MKTALRTSLFLLVGGLFLVSCTHRPRVTAISGVVNSYAAVEGIECATLTVDRSDGFYPDQLVLVIQMQGATINQSNTKHYGRVGSWGGVGTAEYARIDEVDGQKIHLENRLLHRYQIDGSVQIVSVAEYKNVLVEGPVHALPWNGRVGGVVAIHAVESLRLSADIDASAQGFRGGKTIEQKRVPYQYIGTFVGHDRDALGMKGESSARLGRRDGRLGRGAPANGGGGGNNHNAGGGGGAHIGAGGNGGYAYPHSRYAGDRKVAQGLGGHPARLRGRLLMGGGGGAGHSNNKTGSDGGHGGGIVIVKAKKIIGEGGAIRAGGEDSETAAYDGAGGAGAGGSVWLSTLRHDGSEILLDATGGTGGNTANDVEQQHVGAGGGGGGGRIWLSDVTLERRSGAYRTGFAILLKGGSGGRTIRGTNDGTTDGGHGFASKTFPIPIGTATCDERDDDDDDFIDTRIEQGESIESMEID